MLTNLENRFDLVRSDLVSDLFDGRWFRIERGEHLELEVDDLSGCFLARFNTRLMVRIDVYQGSVVANSSLEKCYQKANRKRGDDVNDNGKRFSAILIQSPPGSLIKPVQKVAR